jgi:hypothetical protein
MATLLPHFRYNTAEVTIHSSTMCGPTSQCITVLIRVPALTERVLIFAALTKFVSLHSLFTHSLRVPALTVRVFTLTRGEYLLPSRMRGERVIMSRGDD